jgi:hypothetical protein
MSHRRGRMNRKYVQCQSVRLAADGCDSGGVRRSCTSRRELGNP